MEYLLDTHTFIWFINGSRDLSATARKAITTSTAVNFVSMASLWEIAIKISLGKLQFKGKFVDIEKQLENNGFQLLPISFKDTELLLTLPFHHRDPFDRMIIAQALNQNFTIVSKDSQFPAYDIKILW